jgi:hypothetical protein
MLIKNAVMRVKAIDKSQKLDKDDFEVEIYKITFKFVEPEFEGKLILKTDLKEVAEHFHLNQEFHLNVSPANASLQEFAVSKEAEE